MINKERFNHYLVGDDNIDHQHWEILKSAENVENSTTKEEALHHIQETIEMWIQHSLVEHRIMANIRFPFMNHHINEHENLMKRFEDVKGSLLDDSKPYYASRYSNRLIELILTHIDNMDMQLTKFIRENKKWQLTQPPSTG